MYHQDIYYIDKKYMRDLYFFYKKASLKYSKSFSFLLSFQWDNIVFI